MPRGKRGHQDLSKLPAPDAADHRWTLAEGVYDDAPLLLRFNELAKNWVGHPGLPIKLGFAILLNDPNEGGLPDPDEFAVLGDIEDVIFEEVEAKTTGMLVMILTTGVMRELVYYIAPGSDIGAIHQAIQGRVTTHEVQCMAVNDPTWDAYTELVGV